ncbi:MAG: hypothetical protein E7231_04050 [Cellulosilyticum sp.]|nr:hypothetical protein [Cellulosilyticum sp.]
MELILILKSIFCVASIGVIYIILREIIRKKTSKQGVLQSIFESKKRIIIWYLAAAMIYEVIKLVIERVGA